MARPSRPEGYDPTTTIARPTAGQCVVTSALISTSMSWAAIFRRSWSITITGIFQFFCYSNLSVEDEVTQRIQRCSLTDGGPSATSADEQVVGMIRDDGIDILVDLAQHMADNRLLVAAAKPALPVQVGAYGLPGDHGPGGHRLPRPAASVPWTRRVLFFQRSGQ